MQTHGNEISWRNLFVRKIGSEEANKFLASIPVAKASKQLFDGKSLAGWTGAKDNYEVVDGAIQCKTGHGGVLHTKTCIKTLSLAFEFKLPPGGNNGLAIRYPGEKDTAYYGMCELQVLDTEHPKYAKLDPRQAHGSAYGMAAATRGYLRPTGEWNFQVVNREGFDHQSRIEMAASSWIQIYRRSLTTWPTRRIPARIAQKATSASPVTTTQCSSANLYQEAVVCFGTLGALGKFVEAPPRTARCSKIFLSFHFLSDLI